MTFVSEDATNSIVIAVSKGRIFDEAMPFLRRVGFAPTVEVEASRKLIVPTEDPDVKLLIVRATDVPTYVEYGAADVGIVGRDTIVEHPGDGCYQPLDLKIARCRLVVAGVVGANINDYSRPRVATKYVHIARDYFAKKGMQAEIIKLYGSMELAPLVGLADLIVDIVDTGNTLKANGMEPLETIFDVSSWLLVNKAAMKTKPGRIGTLINALADEVTQSNG